MEHVMAQAPGYNKLMKWTDHPIMPTPGAVGEMIKKIAEVEKNNIIYIKKNFFSYFFTYPRRF